MTSIQQFGIEIIQYLQSFHPDLDIVMGILAFTVKPEYFIVFIMPLLFWNTHKERIFALFVVLMIDISVGEILRALFAQPRPWWIADLVPLDPVTSVYSSPGGYSSFAVVFYGYLAYHFRRRAFTLVGVGMILFTGIAKMYEAAMLIDHMFWGIVQGLVILFLFLRAEARLFSLLQQLSRLQAVAVSMGLVAVLFALDALALELQSGYTLPVSWAKYQMDTAERLADGGMVYACGFLLGALLAYKWYYKQFQSQVLGLGYKIIQSIVGIVGVVMVFIILRQMISQPIEHLGLIWAINMVFAVLSGLWVFYWLPAVMHAVFQKRQARSLVTNG